MRNGISDAGTGGARGGSAPLALAPGGPGGAEVPYAYEVSGLDENIRLD